MGRKEVVAAPVVASKDIVLAIAGGKPAIAAFIDALAPEAVLPFLAKAAPVKKSFEAGILMAETRVATEKIVARGGEWVDKETGVIYVWDGALGDPFVADPAELRSGLEMEDVKGKDLDEAVYQVWKVDFTNLKNIENTALRTIDNVARTTEADRARAKRIVEIIKRHRDRKPNGPAHLKVKD